MKYRNDMIGMNLEANMLEGIIGEYHLELTCSIPELLKKYSPLILSNIRCIQAERLPGETRWFLSLLIMD